MRGLLKFFIVLAVSGFCSKAVAQVVDPKEEVEKILSSLEVYDSMLRTGVDTPDVRYGEYVLADQLIELFIKHSNLYLHFDLLEQWFSMEISEEYRFRMMTSEAIAIVMLSHEKEVDGIRSLKEMGVLDYLNDRFPGKEPKEHRAWIIEQEKMWAVRVRAQLASNDPNKRAMGMRYIFQNGADFHFQSQFSQKVVGPLSAEQKIRLLEDIIERPMGGSRDFYLAWFLKEIPWSYWKARHQHLLVKLFKLASFSEAATGRIVLALAIQPEMAKDRVPLTRALGVEEDTFKRFYNYNGEGLMLIEQLFLMSDMFRKAIYHFYITPQNAWSVSLIQFHYDNFLPTTIELASALAKAPATHDPRWFEWVLRLDDFNRRRQLKEFISNERLYRVRSEMAFELQQRLFADTELSLKHNYVIPMKTFIEKAAVNPRLVEMIINGWGATILSQGKVSLTRAFVEKIYFHKGVDPGTRMYWLELILMNGPLNDIITLERLIKGHGMGNDLKIEMARAYQNSDLEAEIMRDSLIETLLADSQKPGVITCRQVFAF